MAAWREMRVALALALAACGGTPPREDPSASTSSAIIDGVDSTNLQDFVVQVVHPVDGGADICSGSLVAKNLVLTARHCVSVTPDVGFSCDESGDGTDGGAIGADYDPSTVYVYAGLEAPNEFTEPAAQGLRFFHDGAGNVCDHDLALIELSQAIDGAPLATLDLDSTLRAGQDITAIGWGVTSDGTPPNIRQQLTGIPILAIGPSSNAAGFDVAPNEFEVGQSICEGDSGGPALDSAGAIVGVVSRGGNGVSDASAADPAVTCVGAGTVNIYTETSAFRDVILGAFAAVGATPSLVEVALGEPCTASNECGSGLCARVGSASAMTCTLGCATTACPDGFRCDESLCAPAPSSGCSVARDEEVASTWWLVALGGFAVTCLRAARARAAHRAS